MRLQTDAGEVSTVLGWLIIQKIRMEKVVGFGGHVQERHNFLSMLYMCYKQFDKRFAIVHGKRFQRNPVLRLRY